MKVRLIMMCLWFVLFVTLNIDVYSQSCYCFNYHRWIWEDGCNAVTNACTHGILYQDLACCDDPGPICNYHIGQTNIYKFELIGNCSNPVIWACNGCNFTWSATYYEGCQQKDDDPIATLLWDVWLCD